MSALLHCIADLIMLGLATHEPNFTIIREEFKQSKPKPCEICNQEGHSMNDCTGAVREKQGEVWSVLKVEYVYRYNNFCCNYCFVIVILLCGYCHVSQ